MFHPDDASLLADFAQLATTQQNSRQVEVRAIGKDGTTFDAEINTGIIQGDGLVCNIRDITERKAQERQLRYHAAMQENVSDAVIVTDMQFRIQSWNQAAVRMYGWTAEEAIGKVAPDFLQIRFSPAMNRESGLKQFNAEGALQQETIQRRKDGTDIFILGSATRLDDEKGVPVGVIAINRNITERKAQERQLRYHASIQESVSDAVIATDMQFHIQSWNRTAELIYGWPATEALGKSVNELLQTTYASAEDGERILRDFFERGAWQGEVIQHDREGRPIYIHASVNLFKDETGQPIGVVSVNRDITERKRAAEALRESEERFRRAIMDAPFPIMIHADNGEVLHISNVWAEISGYTHAEIPTMSAWIEKAYPENSQTARALIEKVYTLTKPRRGGEFQVRTKAGEERIWDFMSAPLAVMPDGRRMVSSMAMDITERKQAEATLQNKMAEEHQFQVYLKALHEIIMN